MKTDRLQTQGAIVTLQSKGTENASGLVPIGTKVLVLPDEVGEKTKGGVLLPQQTKENESFAVVSGVIVSVGGAAFTDWPNSDAKWPGKIPNVGDRVVIAKYAGLVIDGKDGKKYRYIQDTDVVGFEN